MVKKVKGGAARFKKPFTKSMPTNLIQVLLLLSLCVFEIEQVS